MTDMNRTSHTDVATTTKASASIRGKDDGGAVIDQGTERNGKQQKDKEEKTMDPAYVITMTTAKPMAPTATCEKSITSRSHAEDTQLEEDEEDDDDDDLGDANCAIGFLFEAYQPSKKACFEWKIAPAGEEGGGELTKMMNGQQQQVVRVSMDVADDDPGAVQSGHYLWPAAELLAEYLVQQQQKQQQQQQQSSLSSSSSMWRMNTNAVSVVELGAGCALASLTALQIWQRTLQCVLITDHDPGTVERARNNHETTLEHILDACSTEDDVENAINDIASIPVRFETLKWGQHEHANRLRNECFEEHIRTTTATEQLHLHQQQEAVEEDSSTAFDIVLGSDLIYCEEVVRPLLETASKFMLKKGHFILSQSFSYEDATEKEIDHVCNELGLKRQIVFDHDHGEKRIQCFYAKS